MMFRRSVSVPPTCPSSTQGCLANLRRVPFTLLVHECDMDKHDRHTQTEIFASFGEAGEHGDYPGGLVESGALMVPANSPIAAKARRIVGSSDTMVSATENPQVARIRDALCGRVTHCRGVTNGECWALGAAAIKRVIEQA